MGFFEGLVTITFVHLLASASPGPDFVMVTQQSLIKGRKAGILCSLGIALGLSVHIVYSSIGMAAIVNESSSFLVVLKTLAAMYLIYLGLKGICSKPQETLGDEAYSEMPVSKFKTISMGFLCNALNPKAPLYFLSLFTLVLSTEMPVHQIIFYGLWMMVVQFSWFSMVAVLLSKPVIKSKFRKIGHWIDRCSGLVMIAFGLMLLISKSQ